ncbi:MAG: hypothetical protein ACKVW3_05780 [Phycisphaerales bacterium]
MALVIAGVDEAGYGPTLGPLCVGMAVFRVDSWSLGEPAPYLWKLLSAAVTDSPGDPRGRVPIADSKRLKLPNDSTKRHPLKHLERGVLAMLGASGTIPTCDESLLDALGTEYGDEEWSQGPAIGLPLAHTADQCRIDAGLVAAAMERASVSLAALRCRVMGVGEFNEIVARTGSKAEATAKAAGELFGAAAAEHGDGPLRMVCDQLGGRTRYEDVLSRWFPTMRASAMMETEERSRYRLDDADIRANGTSERHAADHVTGGEVGASVESTHHPRRAIHFMPEAESKHLAVALASMVAKLVRELAMMRFNRYWCGRTPDLKPTAGYATDAKRWLYDMREHLAETERDSLVRRA